MVTILREQNGGILLLLLPFIANLCVTQGHFVRRSTLSPGTTKFLTKIFTGRCSDYSDCTLPHNFQCDTDPSRKNINCTNSLNEFLDAFAHMDPCQVPDDAYDEFLKNNMVHSEPDETLFWSGTKDIAINIATITDRYTTIERTAAGYVLNGLLWCGKPGSNNSINQDECPSCEGGVPDATYQFWRSASRHFAAQARGYVSVLLNSTREGGAFRNTSTFAAEELPNINADLVGHVYIHLVRDVNIPDNIPGEDCNNGSILVLRNLLEQKGLNYTCSSDDREFTFLQCVQYPNAVPCHMLNTSSAVISRCNTVFILSFLTFLINMTF